MKKSILLLFLCGCSSAPKVCPTLAEEPVSMCRAEAHCQPSRAALGMAGFSGKQAQLATMRAQEADCVHNHLESQKANAVIGVMKN